MPRILLILLLAPFAALVDAKADTTNAATANPPSTNAPTAITPIAVGQIVTEAQSALTQLEEERGSLNPDPTLQSVEAKLPEITQAIDDRVTADAPLIDGGGSLASLQNSQTGWQGIADDLSTAQKDLSARVKSLDGRLWELSQEQQKWKSSRDTAAKASAPVETLQRIDQVQTSITDTVKLVKAAQGELYLMQNRVAAQDTRARIGMEKMAKAISNARKRLFERDHPVLWDAAALERPREGIVALERTSLGAQGTELEDYLTQKAGAVLAQLLLLVILIFGFFWLRTTTHRHAEKEESLRHAERVFEMPTANALLITLLVSHLFYPEAPRLLSAIIVAFALLPAVIIIRRLIDPSHYPVLYATVAFYAVDQVRFIIRPGGELSRFLLIFELLAICIFLLLALRSKMFASENPLALRFQKMIRGFFHVAFFVFFAAGFANIFGYVPLSFMVTGNMLQSSYDAVLFYAGVRVIDALALSALSIRPLSGLGMVRRHHDLIYENTSTAIRWMAIGIWLLVALQSFTLLEPIYTRLSQFLTKPHSWGSMTDIEIGPILAFPITVWAAFLLSRFIQFCLDEEVYPHLQLGRGIPYAVSTVVHYTILVIGFFIALGAVGLDLTKFTILAGAFGVGLGFGLQNIMNNFMSGLILLFERPIKVGDTIQIDANTTGRVEHIGIRASVILLTNGAELIVPNGNLISSPVTNWTLSNCERLIEIPVTVTSKVDPQHILDLLAKVAAAHTSVLKNPAPQAVLVSFGATLVFRLRAWIDSEEHWMKITSDLSLEVNEALAKEGVTLG